MIIAVTFLFIALQGLLCAMAFYRCGCLEHRITTLEVETSNLSARIEELKAVKS